ncbi:hypothetical protein EMCRGX_G019209 [Ephydatia muelleri]
MAGDTQAWMETAKGRDTQFWVETVEKVEFRFYVFKVRAPWVQHSSHSLDCGLLLSDCNMSTKKTLQKLTCEVLRLRLAQAALPQVGNKDVLVERLFQHLNQPVRADEENGSESDSSPSTDDAMPPAKGCAHRLAPAGLTVGGIATVVARKPTAGLPTTTPRVTTSERASGSKRSWRQSSSSSSDSSSESTSSSSESSDSEDTASDSDRRRRRNKRHRRCHRSRPTHCHGFPQVLASPFISCAPTPNRREIRKIKRGKYVLFDKLLPPLDDGQMGQAAKKGCTKRQVSDLSSWMEAWNIFAATHVQVAPQTALELVKYQNIICQLFTAYSAAAALKYDKLFWQAVARDKLHTLRWDILKEDILPQAGQQAQQQATRLPAVAPHPEASTIPSEPPTSQARKSAGGTTLASAAREQQTVGETIPPRPAHALHQWPRELQRAHTTLRRSNFEHKLRSHPDKAWVTWLLDGIDNGVSIGYIGPVVTLKSRNLSSAHTHPDVVDAELAREIAAGRIIGPFTEPPWHNLRTSGIGVVPKKNGKWRAILHLSAPEGHSVNDHINKDEFSIHYSSVDDAVALLSQYGQDALMAKVDLKAAFRLIHVRAADWVHLGICWRDQFYVDTCLPFGLRSAPALFNHYTEALHWIMANRHGAQLLHYLEDFLLVGPPGRDTCQEAMFRMLMVCDHLGIPVASEKLEGPTTALTFLGIVLDTSAKQLRLPPDKLEELTGLIRCWLGRHKATKRELLSLIGKLSFAAKVVPAGRLFLCRLIDLSTTARKLHHHVTLNAEARADIKW